LYPDAACERTWAFIWIRLRGAGWGRGRVTPPRAPRAGPTRERRVIPPTPRDRSREVRDSIAARPQTKVFLESGVATWRVRYVANPARALVAKLGRQTWAGAKNGGSEGKGPGRLLGSRSLRESARLGRNRALFSLSVQFPPLFGGKCKRSVVGSGLSLRGPPSLHVTRSRGVRSIALDRRDRPQHGQYLPHPGAIAGVAAIAGVGETGITGPGRQTGGVGRFACARAPRPARRPTTERVQKVQLRSGWWPKSSGRGHCSQRRAICGGLAPTGGARRPQFGVPA
jgi:hypothetical protein